MQEGITARLMRPGDGQDVVALWQKFLPDTETWTAWLPDMIDDLIAARVLHGGVVMTQTPVPRCVALGVSCFLPDAVAATFTQAPRPYLNRRLLTTYRDGDTTVFLTPEEQATHNAGDGLELFILEYCQETFDFEDLWAHHILNAIVPVYIEAHAGFNIKRSMHETEVAVGHIQESGGNPYMFDVAPQDPFSLSPKGHGPRAVYGVSRAALSIEDATGISKALLFYQAPKFQLVLREQEVALFALEGLTDVEIAKRMGLSRDRVRQIWQDIYDHIESVELSFFGSVAAPVEGVRRGGEKRRLCVAHLRKNPQELRPRVLKRK